MVYAINEYYANQRMDFDEYVMEMDNAFREMTIEFNYQLICEGVGSKLKNIGGSIKNIFSEALKAIKRFFGFIKTKITDFFSRKKKTKETEAIQSQVEAKIEAAKEKAIDKIESLENSNVEPEVAVEELNKIKTEAEVEAATILKEDLNIETQVEKNYPNPRNNKDFTTAINSKDWETATKIIQDIGKNLGVDSPLYQAYTAIYMKGRDIVDSKKKSKR